jgi:hypothetical protein
MSASNLTERQQFWLAHIRACGRGSLKAYAAAHDLHVSSLYEAKSKLRRLGVLEESPPRVTPSRLVRVPPEAVRPSAPTMCRIHLRNGTVVEVAGAPEQLPGLIECVAALA